MIYVKIAGETYPAEIAGKMTDRDWDNRPSKSVTLEMSHDKAVEVWIEGAEWSILTENVVIEPQFDEEGNELLDENGEVVMVENTVIDEFDNSEYNLAGDITDHRDGTVTVKMGKLTDLEEAYEIMLGGM